MSVKRRSLATQSTGVSPIASARLVAVSSAAFDFVGEHDEVRAADDVLVGAALDAELERPLPRPLGVA